MRFYTISAWFIGGLVLALATSGHAAPCALKPESQQALREQYTEQLDTPFIGRNFSDAQRLLIATAALKALQQEGSEQAVEQQSNAEYVAGQREALKVYHDEWLLYARQNPQAKQQVREGLQSLVDADVELRSINNLYTNDFDMGKATRFHLAQARYWIAKTPKDAARLRQYYIDSYIKDVVCRGMAAAQ